MKILPSGWKAVHPEVVVNVGRASQWGGWTAGWSAEREAVRTPKVAIRCGGWTPPHTQKSETVIFVIYGCFWLFQVVCGLF